MPTALMVTVMYEGEFATLDGVKIAFTQADLASLAESYDDRIDAAPLVIGEPKLDDPAYGWVRNLVVMGNRVVADVSHVEPVFGEAVRKGQFTSVKSSFYAPADPNNPKLGAWYLRHVRFDGLAHPPLAGRKGIGFAQYGGDATVGLPAAIDSMGRSFEFKLPPGYSADPDQLDLYRRAMLT